MAAASDSATIGNNAYNGMHTHVAYGKERGGIMIDALKKSGDGIRNNHNFDVQNNTLESD